MAAQDRELFVRVSRRIEWDKQLVGSTIPFEIRADSAVVLKGSVMST
jgi:hypothetical protein